MRKSLNIVLLLFYDETDTLMADELGKSSVEHERIYNSFYVRWENIVFFLFRIHSNVGPWFGNMLNGLLARKLKGPTKNYIFREEISNKRMPGVKRVPNLVCENFFLYFVNFSYELIDWHLNVSAVAVRWQKTNAFVANVFTMFVLKMSLISRSENYYVRKFSLRKLAREFCCVAEQQTQTAILLRKTAKPIRMRARKTSFVFFDIIFWWQRCCQRNEKKIIIKSCNGECNIEIRSESNLMRCVHTILFDLAGLGFFFSFSGCIVHICKNDLSNCSTPSWSVLCLLLRYLRWF